MAAARGVVLTLRLLLLQKTSVAATWRVVWQSAQPATSCSIQSSTAAKAAASCTMLLSDLLPGAYSALLRGPALSPSAPWGPDTPLLPTLAPLMLLARCTRPSSRLSPVPLASPASAPTPPAAPLLAAVARLLAALLPAPPAAADGGAIHAVCCRQKQMASALKLWSSTNGRCSSRGSVIQMLLMTACRSFCWW